MQKPDTPDGLFHDGNPATGQKGTPITAAWLNAVLTISTLFRGTTEPPVASLGDDGDFYICVPNRNMYGPKTTGAWGDAWVQGLPGPRGYRWYWGSGAPGAIAGQLTGDFYINIDAAEIWTLASGVWGSIGHIRGKSLLSGNSDPLPGDGIDGDCWINTTTMTFYGPKSVGAWGAGQLLIGPPGISSYLYLAYADTAAGVGFSLTPTPSALYIAFLVTHFPIATLTAVNFTGLWKLFVGADSGSTPPPPSGLNTVIPHPQTFSTAGNFPVSGIRHISLMWTPANTTGEVEYLWSSYIDNTHYTALLWVADEIIFRKRVPGQWLDVSVPLVRITTDEVRYLIDAYIYADNSCGVFVVEA